MSCGCGGSSKTGSCGCGSSGSCGCGGSSGGACGGPTGRATGLGGSAFLRPRFFAGQLLTEDDLGSIVEYTLSKSRLHNRYFMGAGVVCGLTASCSPARGVVRIAAGYALDCCGNDVVVPCDVELPVLEMIGALPRVNSCGQPCTEAPTHGADPSHESAAEPVPAATAAEDAATLRDPSGLPKPQPVRTPSSPCRTYTLVLVYDEEPTELVAAYPIDQDPCGQSPTCEASLVREGYRFEMRCGHPDNSVNTILDELECCLAGLCIEDQHTKNGMDRSTYGAMSDLAPLLAPLLARRVGTDRSSALVRGGFGKGLRGLLQGCFARLENIASTPEKNLDNEQWLGDLRQRMIERLESRPLTSCTLLCDVEKVRIAGLESTLKEAAKEMQGLLLRLLLECICDVINPPCAPCDDPAIVLATICVDDCDVVDICNAVRRFVLTGPTLRYWIPPLSMVETFVEELCCNRSKFLPSQEVPEITEASVETITELTAKVDQAEAAYVRAEEKLHAMRVLHQDAAVAVEDIPASRRTKVIEQQVIAKKAVVAKRSAVAKKAAVAPVGKKAAVAPVAKAGVAANKKVNAAAKTRATTRRVKDGGRG